METPAWMAERSCRSDQTGLFYSDQPAEQARAKSICVDCPVQADCLAHALIHREKHGIWGGLLPAERKRLT